MTQLVGSDLHLVEDTSRSHGEASTPNMLIHGESLAALELLRGRHSGAIRCIHLDPPFNTGERFDLYDDARSHGGWLAFMRERVRILWELLDERGFFVCHIDDYECHDLKANLLDEIFGRANYWGTLYVRTRHPDPSAPDRSSEIHKAIEMVLVYRKGAGARASLRAGQAIEDFIDGASLGDRTLEGGVRFRGGKKPERLIHLLLEHFASPEGYVLDCFLGSGTTAAVAQKMNVPWIGIERGEQAITHCLPRLQRVIDGRDPTGMTSALDWRGGGGFKFYELS